MARCYKDIPDAIAFEGSSARGWLRADRKRKGVQIVAYSPPLLSMKQARRLAAKLLAWCEAKEST